MHRRLSQFSGVLATLSLAMPGAAFCQATDADANKTAYLYSIRCYVANDVAATDKRFGSDAVHIGKLRDQAQKSYQFIFQLGRVVGNSDALVREDIASYRTILTGAFARDDKLFQRTRDECARLGLM